MPFDIERSLFNAVSERSTKAGNISGRIRQVRSFSERENNRGTKSKRLVSHAIILQSNTSRLTKSQLVFKSCPGSCAVHIILFIGRWKVECKLERVLNSAKGIAESVAILYSIRSVDVSGDAWKNSKVISASI